MVNVRRLKRAQHFSAGNCLVNYFRHSWAYITRLKWVYDFDVNYTIYVQKKGFVLLPLNTPIVTDLGCEVELLPCPFYG